MHKAGYKFTNKKHPLKGSMAFVLGVISLAAILLAIYLTFMAHGVAEKQYGTVVLVSILFSITGLVMAIMSLMEQEIYRFFPIGGVLLNTLSIVLAGFILYLGVNNL